MSCNRISEDIMIYGRQKSDSRKDNDMGFVVFFFFFTLHLVEVIKKKKSKQWDSKLPTLRMLFKSREFRDGWYQFRGYVQR